jgi:hypothetical protein
MLSHKIKVRFPNLFLVLRALFESKNKLGKRTLIVWDNICHHPYLAYEH